MDEISYRRYLKMVMRYGISKTMANEILEVSFKTSKGNNIEKYINYSIDLVYGLGLSQKAE